MQLDISQLKAKLAEIWTAFLKSRAGQYLQGRIHDPRLRQKLSEIRDRILAGRAWAFLKKLDNPRLRQQIMETWNRVRNSKKRDNILRQTYLPFIGWILSMAYLNDDENARYHFKRALVMAAAFASVLTILSFLLVTSSLNSRILRLILTVLIYILEMVYFALCITGTTMIVRNRRIEIPLLNKYAGYVNI